MFFHWINFCIADCCWTKGHLAERRSQRLTAFPQAWLIE